MERARLKMLESERVLMDNYGNGILEKNGK